MSLLHCMSSQSQTAITKLPSPPPHATHVVGQGAQAIHPPLLIAAPPTYNLLELHMRCWFCADVPGPVRLPPPPSSHL
jgi:hypothetical protein